jgi:putative acetyltransferase
MIRIRTGTPSDAAAVTDLVFAALREHGIEPDPHGSDADVVSFGKGATLELLAEDEGKILGMAILWDRGPDTPGAYLSKLFVAKAARGAGIGGALVEATIKAARARGHRRLSLRTRTVFGRAIALYESLGFERLPDPPSTSHSDRAYVLTLA